MIKFKKSFISNLLVKKGIPFTKCGVSQQTYEYMRDGKRISNAAVSKFEKACDVIRDIDFPMEYDSSEKDKKFSARKNYINFDFVDLECTSQEPEKKLEESKRMHKLEIHLYKKIKKIKFEEIKWACEVPAQDLSDQNILKSPFLSKEYSHKKEIRKTRGNINDWGDIKDIDTELIDQPITLKRLLEKFDENFFKEDVKKNNFTAGSNSLAEAVEKNEKNKKSRDQIEIILDYLSFNGYEFQYFILQTLDEANLKIDRRSEKELNKLYKAELEKNSEDFDYILKRYYGRKLNDNLSPFDATEIHSYKTYDKSDTRTLEANYLGTDLEGMEGENSSVSAAQGLIQRYIENCENAEYVSFKFSKFRIYISLVKSNTVNYALHNDHQYSIWERTFRDTSKFHSLQKIWAKNHIKIKGITKPSVTFLNGKYIPNAIPIISQKDYDNFCEDLFKENTEPEVTNRELQILEDSIGEFELHKNFFIILKKIFQNKKKFANYLWMLDVQFRNNDHDQVLDIMSDKITFPSYRNIYADRYKANIKVKETDKIKCLPSYTAYYDSYLSYLATYYKYYYDKVPDAEYSDFVDLFIKDIFEYNYFFGKKADIKDSDSDSDSDSDLDLDFLDISAFIKKSNID